MFSPLQGIPAAPAAGPMGPRKGSAPRPKMPRLVHGVHGVTPEKHMVRDFLGNLVKKPRRKNEKERSTIQKAG